jgi:ATP-dependent DNA helicase RecG
LRYKFLALKKEHASLRRNELIADIFYRRKYIDAWGTGIERMIKLCQSLDIPEPEFSEYSGGISVKFRFSEPISYTSQQVTLDVSQCVLTERQKEILKILATGEKKAVREVVALLTNNSAAARTVGDDLAYLKQLTLVRSEGIGKGSKWYISTQKNQK